MSARLAVLRYRGLDECMTSPQSDVLRTVTIKTPDILQHHKSFRSKHQRQRLLQSCKSGRTQLALQRADCRMQKANAVSPYHLFLAAGQAGVPARPLVQCKAQR